MERIPVPKDVQGVIKRRVLLAPLRAQRSLIGLVQPEAAAWASPNGLMLALTTRKGVKGAESRLQNYGSPYPGIGPRSAKLVAEADGRFLFNMEGRQSMVSGGTFVGGGVAFSPGASGALAGIKIKLSNGISYDVDFLYVAALPQEEWSADLEVVLVRLFSIDRQAV